MNDKNTTYTPQRHSLLLGVTGGIAAYKVATLARLLVKEGMKVNVVMTEAATRFVTPTTFSALTGNPVYSDLWSDGGNNAMPHIELSRGRDAILVAPASANFIAKVAAGLADDLLSNLCLARDCPLIIAPAMNQAMWHNAALQRNLAQLIKDGVHVVGPDEGSQACGEEGFGRLEEPEIIFHYLCNFFAPKRLLGHKVLVTAGPTFEAWDAVRGLSNMSSGKMGFSMAEAACREGAEVILIAGPVSLPTPVGVTRVDVISALDMQRAVQHHLPATSLFISVAAVSDFRPIKAKERKIKKDNAKDNALVLTENPDILAGVVAGSNPPFCVGFAAESHDIEKNAESKRQRKKLPLLVANLIKDGLGHDDNTVLLFDDEGIHPLPRGDKKILARQIIDHIIAMRTRAPTSLLDKKTL